MRGEKLAAARGIDIGDPKLALALAAERLSIARYVFLVQIEDGIASADQRASMEYADAVLMGWPEPDSRDIHDVDEAELKSVYGQIDAMEGCVAKFSRFEHKDDVDGMGDALIRITERVAEIRRLYQPGFLLPTFAEIRRVVEEEWDEDMGKIASNDDEVDLEGQDGQSTVHGPGNGTDA